MAFDSPTTTAVTYDNCCSGKNSIRNVSETTCSFDQLCNHVFVNGLTETAIVHSQSHQLPSVAIYTLPKGLVLAISKINIPKFISSVPSVLRSIYLLNGTFII